MVALSTLAALALSFWVLAWPDSHARIADPNSNMMDGGLLALHLITMILFGRWIYIAGTNAIAMGHDTLKFTPAARIWWFAVPFACLIKPYEGMRELWNASHGETRYDQNHGLITLWWALWLATGFFAVLLVVYYRAEEPGIAGLAIEGALSAALALAASIMIFRITRAQQGAATLDIAEIFT